MLSHNSRTLGSYVVAKMKKTNRETLMFFFYIQQYLVIMALYQFISEINSVMSRITGRAHDTIRVIMGVSSLLMIYGIGNSIKRAMDTDMKQ